MGVDTPTGKQADPPAGTGVLVIKAATFDTTNLPVALSGTVKADGVDVKATTRKTRYVDAEQRAALFVRDHGGCVINGCSADRRLEMDHWDVPFAADGPTRIDNLVLLCVFHHALKTRKGFRLEGGPGNWKLVPPARAPAGCAPP